MLFLVVDDDALSRELLTLLLESEGYEVEVAVSGEEVLARIASQTEAMPDVILTDVQMPGVAGDALAKALKPSLGSRTLLIAMSGSQPAAAVLARFDGFLLKPFHISELRSMVETRRTLVTVLGTCVHDSETPDPALVRPEALDEEIYSKLGELMPPEPLGQMYALCVADARKRISHMRALAEAGDDAQYCREAHAVKGGSGMIGAKELYELAATAESNGLGPDQSLPGTTSVTAALTQLSLACDRLERILDERTRE